MTGPSLGVVNFRSTAGVTVEQMMAEVIVGGRLHQRDDGRTASAPRASAPSVTAPTRPALRSVIEAAAAAR